MMVFLVAFVVSLVLQHLVRVMEPSWVRNLIIGLGTGIAVYFVTKFPRRTI